MRGYNHPAKEKSKGKKYWKPNGNENIEYFLYKGNPKKERDEHEGEGWADTEFCACTQGKKKKKRKAPVYYGANQQD